MNACCCLVKFFVVLMNLVFWLAGLVIVALAVWMLVDPTFTISLTQENQSFQIALAILLAIGILMIILAFCGCCGAFKESQCMLVSFFCCMLIVLTAEIAAGVWSYQNSDKLRDFVTKNLKTSILEDYDVSPSRTETIDAIQKHWQCCGANGPSDYVKSKFNIKPSSSSSLLMGVNSPQLVYSVPHSCCKNGTDSQVCNTSRKGALTTAINPVINTNGCIDQVVKDVKDNVEKIIIGGLIVISVQLFGVLLVLCLCCGVKSNKYDDYKD